MSTVNPLKDFVVLDLETTGLDPAFHRIIEVGLVRVREGQVVAELSQLIDPGIPIPPDITRLTGITQDDCRGQPTIQDVLPDAVAFLGPDPLVAHNVTFDAAFLRAALERDALPAPGNLTLDTLLLSCILLPRLRDHRLATLVDYFGVCMGRAHRAVEDARATAQVYLSLVRMLAILEPGILALLARLSAGSDSGLEAVFVQGLKESFTSTLGRKIPAQPGRQDLEQDFFNLSGEADQEASVGQLVQERQAVDASDLISLFGSGTPLGRALGDYEQRLQQLEMVQAVARAFNWSEFLAVEAGTGTGKSLAYLIPATHWAVRNAQRVIISTHTKNLQEQLFYKDLPLLHRALELSFAAALVKGRANYLCLNKWNLVLSQAEGMLTARERRLLLPLVLWAQETRTGDIAENTGFSQDGELWGKVCAERHYCQGPRCPYHGSCFLMRIRRAAAQAHIVVVNHSLFFSDLASDNAVLSDYDHVIFDEAHRLEEVATQYLGTELNWWMVRALLNRLYQRERMELGTLPALQRRVEHARVSQTQREALRESIERAVEARQEMWPMGMDFFNMLTQKALAVYGRSEGTYPGKYRYRRDGEFLQLLSRAGQDLEEAMVRLKASIVDLASLLEALEPSRIKDGEQLLEDLLARARDSQELIDASSHLLSAQDDSFVYWVETPARQDSFDARLFSAPLHVAQLMRTLVYNRLQTAVHTSATLTVAGQFDYFLDRIGLSLIEPERLRTLAVGSPFQFEHQALVCLPTWLPSPKDPHFLEEAVEALYAAILASRGGALVLFTSYEMLDRAYQSLWERLAREGILVLGQGRDGSRTNILNRFREEPEAVLMGTSSFWEGVDIPGPALRCLILFKLPFQVPSEPIVEAHMELLEKKGRSAFNEYLLPEAVIRFRQGFGRLIRRADDRGVVIILDRRVWSAGYGTAFLRSLPTGAWAVDSLQALQEDIRRWLGAQKKPPSGGSVGPFDPD